MDKDDGQVLVLRPRRLKMALFAILSAAFTAGGVAMIRDGADSGWFVAGFFGLCLAVFLVMLMPGAAALRLTQDGFHVRSFWRDSFTPWSAVGGFGVVRISHRSLVAFNRVDGARSRYRRFSRSLTGVDSALPDTYGMSARDLAALMNAWRARASATPECGVDDI